MTHPRALAVTFAVSFALVAQSATATLFFSQDSNPNGLYSIDTNSGLATNIGTSGVNNGTVGLSPSGTPGLLFGGQPFGLLSINADGSGSASAGTQGIEGLAYDPVNDILYGQLNSDFFTLNQGTGAKVDNVANAPGDMDGLAFGRGGVFGLNDSNDSLYFYNPIGDTWSLVGALGIAVNNPGLAYDPSLDTLYAIGGSALLSVNADNGTATTIGNHGLGNVGGGLAFVSAVPEPATLLLLGLGIVAVGYQRRKRAN